MARLGQRIELIEKLISSEAKAELLILFHNHPELVGSLDELAERIGRESKEIKKDVDELARIGLLNENAVYSFNHEKDRQIQETISRQVTQETPHDEEVILEVSERRRTGIEILDNLLSEGYVFPISILVLGDPGTNTTIFCQQFIRESLESGQLCIYACCDDFPDSIRRSICELQVDAEFCESIGNLIFIDCYSWLIGLESKERLFVDSYSLSSLSISLSKALARQKQLGTATLVLDSLSTLIQKCGVQPSMEFLRTLIAKSRMFRSNCLVKLNRKAFPSVIIAAIEDMVDCVIEMKTEEEPSGLNNYLRISKLRNAKFKTTWTPYETSSDRGLVEKEESENDEKEQ